MRRRQEGFSLIELLVTMVIFSIIIVAASQTFVNLLSNFKTQSKITATNIEGMLGLEVMRRDIAQAGYGLYYQNEPKTAPTNTPTYTEVLDANGSQLNDATTGLPPRALVFGGSRGLNGSDWIAVKAMNVVSNNQSEHWTYMYSSPTITVTSWGTQAENIGASEYVIVVRPDQGRRYLLFNGSDPNKKFYSRLDAVVANYVPDATSLVFSMGTTTVPRVPFNRADFYVANTGVPSRCAVGTGVLYKSIMDQAGTNYLAAIPLLDCVADMQVAYRFDSDGDGYADTDADVNADQPLDAVSARQIREVRVYLLVQEGQFDRNYTYPNGVVRVGEIGLHAFGRDLNLAARVTNWQNYRWKLYTLIIEPMSLLDWTVF